MKAKTLMIIVLMCSIDFYHMTTEAVECPPDIMEKCPQTEYGAYLKCLKEHRVKRQACTSVTNPCIATCNTGCSQQSCFDNCRTSCETPQVQVCSNCGPSQLIPPYQTNPPILPTQTIPPIQTYPPVQTFPPIETIPSVLSNQSITVVNQSSEYRASAAVPNVTTIIKLTNIVNNTNIVNVPTTINNTNVNNIDLNLNSSSEQDRLKNAQMNSCCMVVEPKKCSEVKNENGELINRCIHRRHRTCGSQCVSKTMHAQVRQKCEGDQTSCPATISYVPQPSPRCTYQSTWPYVSCGTNSGQNCEGCYDHYGYGYQQFHQSNSNPPTCTGCYDDGFELGSLYRQGPIYRPGYYHEPPCYMTGTCGVVQQPMPQAMDCGFGGCFGHELIDPVFGAQAYSPYASSYMMNSYPSYYPQYIQPQMPSMNYVPQIPSMTIPSLLPHMSPMIYPQISPMFPVPMSPFGYAYNDFLSNNVTVIENTGNNIDENAIEPLNGSVVYPYPYPFQPYSYGYGLRRGFNPFFRPSPYPLFNETILIHETQKTK